MAVVVAVVEEKLEGESTTDVRLRFPPRSTNLPEVSNKMPEYV